MVKTLKSSIIHVHYSDFGQNGDCLPFGEGEYDNNALFDELDKNSYTGSIIIELYINGYNNIESLIDNYCLIKETLEERKRSYR